MHSARPEAEASPPRTPSDRLIFPTFSNLLQPVYIIPYNINYFSFSFWYNGQSWHNIGV